MDIVCVQQLKKEDGAGGWKHCRAVYLVANRKEFVFGADDATMTVVAVPVATYREEAVTLLYCTVLQVNYSIESKELEAKLENRMFTFP